MRSVSARFAVFLSAVLLTLAGVCLVIPKARADAAPAAVVLAQAAPAGQADALPERSPETDRTTRIAAQVEDGAQVVQSYAPMLAPVPVIGQWAAILAMLAGGIASFAHAIRTARRDKTAK